jgi:acetyl-CoA carboxylase carboxyltransferase component
VEFIFKYTTFKRKKLPDIFEKYKEIVRTMIKKERERQIKKAYIFYRRRVRTLLATGRYLLTIDYRKKDINNEK